MNITGWRVTPTLAIYAKNSPVAGLSKRFSQKRVEQHARLIGHAPSMLKALQAMVSQFERAGFQNTRVVVKAKALIGEVRGEI